MTISTPTTAQGGRYLTFALGHESYGIEVLAVQEIIRLPAITAVPQLPAYLRGVINLRGKIIPVTDLRARFGLEHNGDTTRTCIVVVQIQRPGRPAMPMGLVVDTVEEVIHIAADDMTPPPEFGTAVDVSFLHALARVKGSVKALLDIQRVLTDSQIDAAAAVAA